MTQRFLIAMALCCALWAAAETPQEGAAAILKLLQQRNYSDLFQQRYSEWYKVKASGAEPAAAVQKLSAMWERNHDAMVKLFTQLTTAEFAISKNEAPQESETGDVATATVTLGERQVPYRLYQMKDGTWGFHM